MCGENSGCKAVQAVSPGSSPRVRGKRGKKQSELRRVGLIPACAGKTLRDETDGATDRAHPRVCGENNIGSFPASKSQGSSPRVRGKPIDSSVFRQHHGLIPACAGKTAARLRRGGWFGAHPRVCGENVGFWGLVWCMWGSSPRVRGKRWRSQEGKHNQRLIPACAGKTQLSGKSGPRQWAHPRVCGENSPGPSSPRQNDGSSPRVRGKQVERVERGGGCGLIPACAGKTFAGKVVNSHAGAHPRVCGENAERSGVLTLRSVRSWKTLSFPSSLKITHCRAFVQLSLSRIRL